MKHNSRLIKELTLLETHYREKGDKWREQAYKRAILGIILFEKEITSVKQLKYIPNIGKGITEKISEYIKDGKISKVSDIKREKTTDYEEIIKLFCEIWGVGPVKARDLYNKGMRSLNDLERNRHFLTVNQRIGLDYYYDLQKPIQRQEIKDYEIALKMLLSKHFGRGTFRLAIAGSYRRGKKESGDVDCLITSTAFNLEEMVEILKTWNLIKNTLSIKTEKFMGIAQTLDSGQYFRLDIEFLPENEWGSGILYFTGSKGFNINTRYIAKEKGLLLNQHGLFDKYGRRIAVYTEREILNYLGIDYVKPFNR